MVNPQNENSQTKREKSQNGLHGLINQSHVHKNPKDFQVEELLVGHVQTPSSDNTSMKDSTGRLKPGNPTGKIPHQEWSEMGKTNKTSLKTSEFRLLG